MSAIEIQGKNVFFLSLYLIFLIQLFMNWNHMNLFGNSSGIQLSFLINAILRILIQELHHNKKINSKAQYLAFAVTDIELIVLGIIFAVKIGDYTFEKGSWDYQNRIVYVS